MIELLVAIVIVAVLATMTLYAANALRERSRKTGTRALLHRVGIALDEYYNKHNKYPPVQGQGDFRWVRKLLAETNLSLSPREWKDNVLIDAWKTPIRYKVLTNPDGYILISAGPDQEFGTDDDIELRK